MNLSSLTTSGWILFAWILFAWTTILSLTFIARMVGRDFRGLWFHVVVLVTCWVWLLWLVTP